MTISSEPDGVWAGFRLSIANRGESGSLRRIGDRERFIIRTDELLIAFLELESTTLGLRAEPFYGELAVRLKE